MCHRHQLPNRFQCIVPPYMTEKIALAAPVRRSLFAGSIKTKFNDELFRRKRTLLTQMDTKEMSIVLKSSLGTVMTAVAEGRLAKAPALALAAARPAKKAARSTAAAAPGPKRMIYDAEHSEQQTGLPGTLKRKEGQRPVADKDVNNIYDNSGHTWNFYFSQFSRDSVDGKGLSLIHSVHFGNSYENAFWEGTQMVYGDGGQVFKSFTLDIDITGHELTHGVVQYEADLQYVGQSGAINESMADVFGIMVRQLALGEDTTKDANWLIGRKCMKGTGFALRSLANPGSAYKNHPILGDDPQPGVMADYRNLPDTEAGDHGGVHINSGIPNHAFYLAAKALGGKPWLKLGQIWYQALCDTSLLKSTSQFADLVNATTTKAEALFGVNSLEAKAVKNAWRAVGL